MTSISRILFVVGLAACGIAAHGAPSGQDPYVGYAYPAGGQQGTSFQVVVRGQRLRSCTGVVVTGTGVSASVIGYEGPSGPLNQLQQEELKRRLQAIREARTGASSTPQKPKKASSESSTTAKVPRVSLPDLPELRNLEQQTPKQLLLVASKYLGKAKRPKPPIAEEVTLEVTVDADATPGDRELRLRTAIGLTNPVVFQVGRIPETRERVKGDEAQGGPQAAQPPVVLNGQVMPGEVDRFPMTLRGGQKLVVAVQARKLIPYLADAVPGWFQAVVSLYDAHGKEVAFADECGFDPDPAFVFQVPRDGQYTLAIRDALYRGREDFVYRVDIVESSSADSLLSLPTRGGVPVGAKSADQGAFSRLAEKYFGLVGAPSSISREAEPNDTTKSGMRVILPCVVSGCIASSKDKDAFRFDGRKGQQIVAEVYARRMGSALDSLVQLIDSTGKVIASNDDHNDMESGLLTHHADSYLSWRLPANGSYTVQVSDAQGHGGAEYGYGLRIGPPRPDFALRVTPSCLNVPAGRSVTATVYVARKDGWDGDIDLTLKNAPEGFSMSGGRIPKGRDKVRVTLTAPRSRVGEPIALQLEGHAQISGKSVTRQAVPADDMMQAFAYHHLVPSEEFLAVVTRGAGVPPRLDMADDRLKIPSGGTAKVSYSVGPVAANAPIHLELNEPPAGITLQDVTRAGGKFTLLLKADDKHAGYEDNLIVEAFTEVDAQGKAGSAGQKQRVSIGVLPSIPFVIAKP